MHKQVSLSIQAPYVTRGKLTPETKHIWLVCHGFGQLARYFIKRFDVLDEDTHYVIAPQGLSRFYMDEYTRVGASWTTREHLEMHIENQLNYLDAVFREEMQGVDLDKVKLHLMGFSQGVSVITRWSAYRKIPFDSLILWAGKLPPELSSEKWTHIKPGSRVFLVIGKKDQYLNDDLVKKEIEKVSDSVKPPVSHIFDGGHEVTREALQEVLTLMN